MDSLAQIMLRIRDAAPDEAIISEFSLDGDLMPVFRNLWVNGLQGVYEEGLKQFAAPARSKEMVELAAEAYLCGWLREFSEDRSDNLISKEPAES